MRLGGVRGNLGPGPPCGRRASDIQGTRALGISAQRGLAGLCPPAPPGQPPAGLPGLASLTDCRADTPDLGPWSPFPGALPTPLCWLGEDRGEWVPAGTIAKQVAWYQPQARSACGCQAWHLAQVLQRGVRSPPSGQRTELRACLAQHPGTRGPFGTQRPLP